MTAENAKLADKVWAQLLNFNPEKQLLLTLWRRAQLALRAREMTQVEQLEALLATAKRLSALVIRLSQYTLHFLSLMWLIHCMRPYGSLSLPK